MSVNPLKTASTPPKNHTDDRVGMGKIFPVISRLDSHFRLPYVALFDTYDKAVAYREEMVKDQEEYLHRYVDEWEVQ